MLGMCFSLSLLFSGVLMEKNIPKPFNLTQNDYKIVVERAEVVSYNQNYMEHLKITTFKYNRTCTAFNVSFDFKVPVRNELQLISQAYRFASNEYRLFPMRVQFHLCDAYANNVAGLSAASKCGNFTNCSFIKARHYYICNFTPDQSKFPPFVPSGRYMTEFQGLYRSAEVFVVRTYSEITRPFGLKW